MFIALACARNIADLAPSENVTDDEELEAIRRRKLAELQKAASAREMMSGLNQPIVLTDSNFASEVGKYPLLLVDFWAPWCGPCRMVAPIIEQLAKEYSGRVAFGKLNVDENQMVAGTFGIQSIPTMMIFRAGKPVDVIVGALPKAQIEMKLKHHSGSGGSIYL
ncbi:MAG TPA: thioredoxin [Nitrososphaera sp.]